MRSTDRVVIRRACSDVLTRRERVFWFAIRSPTKRPELHGITGASLSLDARSDVLNNILNILIPIYGTVLLGFFWGAENFPDLLGPLFLLLPS